MRFLLSTLVATAAVAGASAADAPKIIWKKTVVDAKFRSEGVAVADVNKDGKKDVLNGEFWYEAPDWKPHEMQKPGEYYMGLGKDGKGNNYSHSFACWADDFNGDGYPDLIVIDFPGEPCHWLENPKGKDGHWAKHVIGHSACNETPLYTDLFGTGKRVLIMGFQPKDKKVDGNEGQMAYFTPNEKDPNAPWDVHPISEASAPGKPIPGTMRYSHGLGVGDINGDGKKDVICTGGWWEQPQSLDAAGKPWTFHPANLGEACADMYAVDMDGDGKADILSSSAHKYGIWWHKQRPATGGNPIFEKMDLFPKLVSETHAAHFQDIDGDGRPDLITGKRSGSHGRAEPGSKDPAMLYWFKNTKGADGLVTFVPNTIDDNSGVGTQFEVTDLNGDGLLDVVTSNKKGVNILMQERK